MKKIILFIFGALLHLSILYGQESNTVFISQDLLVVGDPNYGIRENTRSAFVVFRKDADGWSFVSRVHPPEGNESDFFGENLFVSGNEIFVTDPMYNRVYHYRLDKKKVKLVRIYASLESTEHDFGKNICGNENYILISSTQTPDAFSKSKGLVHVFKRTSTTLEFIQTFYPTGSEQTGFGSQMTILANNNIYISSNKSLAAKKQGVIYEYKPSANEWVLDDILKAENSHKKDGFGDIFCSNGLYLFSKFNSKNDRNLSNIEVFYTSDQSLVRVQKINKPTDIPIEGFAKSLTSSADKLYVSFLDKQNKFGMLIYDLTCNDEWELVQRIIPTNNKDSSVLSISAYGNTLAIGTKRSDFNTYFDMMALSDGQVKLYEYHPDSSQIAFIKEVRKEFYISPSGQRHIYSHQFYDTIQNKKGCDSIINIDLTILKKNLTNDFDTIRPIQPKTVEFSERTIKELDTIQLDNELISFSFYDHGQFDNDTISIKLNNNWILIDEEVSKTTKDFYALGKEGINKFLIRAKNEGKEPPNTVSIYFYDSFGKQVFKKSINSSLEESVAIYLDIKSNNSP